MATWFLNIHEIWYWVIMIDDEIMSHHFLRRVISLYIWLYISILYEWLMINIIRSMYKASSYWAPTFVLKIWVARAYIIDIDNLSMSPSARRVTVALAVILAYYFLEINFISRRPFKQPTSQVVPRYLPSACVWVSTLSSTDFHAFQYKKPMPQNTLIIICAEVDGNIEMQLPSDIVARDVIRHFTELSH